MAESGYVLDGDLRIRVSQHDLDVFVETSQEKTGKPYQVVIRELITAFNEGRLRIKPTEDQLKSLKSLGELYNVN